MADEKVFHPTAELVTTSNVGHITSVEDMQRALQRALQDKEHLQVLVNNLWNERAAGFRRNNPAPPPGTPSHDSLVAELRVIDAAFKIAKEVEFRRREDPNDPCVEFHLALRRLIEARTGTTLLFTKQDALDAQLTSSDSYEAKYTQPDFKAPPVVL
jgi:hypothetical protein